MRRTLVLYSPLLVLCFAIFSTAAPAADFGLGFGVRSLKDSGHWILEEKPEETISALVRFL